MNTSVDVELVVFDKDGTLIDFHALWSSRAERAIETICSALGSDQFLAKDLAAALGYNPKISRVISQGPFASGTRSEMEIVVATILFQHQIPWDTAKELACKHFGPVLTTPLQSENSNPAGRYKSAFHDLKPQVLKLLLRRVMIGNRQRQLCMN